MERLMDRIWEYVVHDKSQTMRERLFRLICLVVMFVCLCLILPSNLFEPDMPVLVNVLDIGFGLFALFCFTKSRQGRNYLRTFLITLTLVLSAAWFLDGGMDGSVNYYLFALLLLPMVFFEGHLRWFFTGGILVDFCALNFIGYHFPGLVTRFPHRSEQLTDIISGMVSCSVAIVMLIWAVVRHYDEERQRLASSDERFSKAFQASPNAMGISEMATGRFIEVNEGFSRIYGYSQAEVIGRTSMELGLWNSAEERDAFVQQLRETGLLKNREFSKRTRNGDARLILTSAVTADIGGKKCVLSMIQDVTEQRQAQAEQARLATVVKQSSEIILITDPEGVIEYVNPAFEKTTGYASAEVLGKTPRVLKSGKHDDELYRQLWFAIKRGETWHGRMINRRKDGTFYEEEMSVSPVRDAAGGIINYVAVKRDVTREVQLEAELRQAQKMEAIGQLAGGVAHDFNNILSALLMQTELIGMTDNLTDEAREGLQQICADTRRAADLTRQLLLFSRRQVMRSRVLDLNEVVLHLAKMLQRLIREDVKLQLTLHATPLMTRADSGMLEQVLINLAVNARDAMNNGGQLCIETSETTVDDGAASLNPDARPGRYVCLNVGDTGGGIPPEVLPRIFEPFFTTKEAGKGTGLGLATVFGIVKQHQGWIKLDNRPGEGVTFQVFLPASTVAETEPAPAIDKPKPSGGTETILMVEDEPAVLKPTRTFLKRHGYTVLDATNGVEALKLWEKHHRSVSLLLTDMVMPGGLSGRELARELQGKAPALKVIYVSGYSADIAGKNFQLKQGEAFIQKPFATDYLLETIRRCLDG